MTLGIVVVTSLAVTTSGSGCSLTFSRAPPKHVALGEEFHCTKSNALPLLDSAFAGTQVLRLMLAASLTDADYRNNPSPLGLDRAQDIALGATLLAMGVISAGVGFSRVAACHEALGISDAPPPPYRPAPYRGSTSPRLSPPGPTAVTPALSPPLGATGGATAPVLPSDSAPVAAPDAGTAPPEPPPPPVPQQADDEDPRLKRVRGTGNRPACCLPSMNGGSTFR